MGFQPDRMRSGLFFERYRTWPGESVIEFRTRFAAARQNQDFLGYADTEDHVKKAARWRNPSLEYFAIYHLGIFEAEDPGIVGEKASHLHDPFGQAGDVLFLHTIYT